MVLEKRGGGEEEIPLLAQPLIYLGIFNLRFVLHMRIKFVVRGHHECLNYFYSII